jgi:hypothetical protein
MMAAAAPTSPPFGSAAGNSSSNHESIARDGQHYADVGCVFVQCVISALSVAASAPAALPPFACCQHTYFHPCMLQNSHFKDSLAGDSK